MEPILDRTGTISVLTYNVAGLLEGVSQARPSVSSPEIGRRIGEWDLALVQEDFCYHRLINQTAPQAHRSQPEHVPGCTVFAGPDANMGDGLNRFSTLPFGAPVRHDWARCNGHFRCFSDCLAQKGFSVATHVPAMGVSVDVVNVHLDAGSCEGDRAARTAQIAQLLGALPPERAVILAGDTNLSRDDSDQRLLAQLRAAGFVEACQAGDCSGLLDRIFVRSGHETALEVSTYSRPEGFVNDDGDALSDHQPVAATIRWRRK